MVVRGLAAGRLNRINRVDFVVEFSRRDQATAGSARFDSSSGERDCIEATVALVIDGSQS
jgi:hypothetical protein